ncbi:MAG: hypothetical protein KatS3mg009_0713 [Acidimicrobiia bacterium]|nr:MAG: hypothetical protein KatS3mg009_0713 [Acidimicrobiia bacterium]
MSPPSEVRNSAWGVPPAYQTPGSSGWPGVSQKTRRRLRPSRSPAANAGGADASSQDRPASSERITVGPRCPVLVARSHVRWSRGSHTTCWAM